MDWASSTVIGVRCPCWVTFLCQASATTSQTHRSCSGRSVGARAHAVTNSSVCIFSQSRCQREQAQGSAQQSCAPIMKPLCSQIWSLQLCSRDQSLPGPAPPRQRTMQREPVPCAGAAVGAEQKGGSSSAGAAPRFASRVSMEHPALPGTQLLPRAVPLSSSSPTSCLVPQSPIPAVPTGSQSHPALGLRLEGPCLVLSCPWDPAEPLLGCLNIGWSVQRGQELQNRPLFCAELLTISAEIR